MKCYNKIAFKMKCFQRILALLLFSTIGFQLSAQYAVLPERMWADTTNAPFVYGVASGDPLTDAVIIWTSIVPPDTTINGHQVSWKVALDSTMNDVVREGDFITIAERDWTVKIDVEGLEPYTTYYYQFTDESGNTSAIGRTKTAPDENSDVEDLKFGVASCSSIFSGFFNAYARMAEQDLDLVIHLGDYIYDYVDEDEAVRVPEPLPIDPENRDEFRQRHKYYLLDPDLRTVRQMHPMFCLWDNHDIYKGTEEGLVGSIEAFYEYLPIRQPDNDNPKRIYRSLHYGELADIMFMDIELLRNIDTIPGTDERSLLSNEQYEWLEEELLNSTATWRIIGNQKIFSNWAIDHIPFPLPLGNGVVGDPSSWDGYQAERERVLTLLRENGIDNNIVVSGDLHISIAADLVINPKDSLEYNPLTGEGALGVEFLPASITRGNVDELLDIPPTSTSLDFLIDLSYEGNPHHEFLEVYQHGYGLLHLNADSTIAQYWYSEKLEVTDEEVMWKELVIREGENHWVAEPIDTMTTTPNDTVPDNTGINELINAEFSVSEVHPNPSTSISKFELEVAEQQQVNISLLGINGQNLIPVKEIFQGNINPNKKQVFEINASELVAGTYLIYLKGEKFVSSQKFVVF